MPRPDAAQCRIDIEAWGSNPSHFFLLRTVRDGFAILIASKAAQCTPELTSDALKVRAPSCGSCTVDIRSPDRDQSWPKQNGGFGASARAKADAAAFQISLNASGPGTPR